MKILATVSSLPNGAAFLFTLLLVTVVLICGLLFYALREKGDVRAQLSLRLFIVTFEAKEGKRQKTAG